MRRLQNRHLALWALGEELGGEVVLAELESRARLQMAIHTWSGVSGIMCNAARAGGTIYPKA